MSLLEVLVVFSAMPFGFFVTILFASTYVINSMTDADKLWQFSRWALAAYYLLPFYATIDFLSKVIWQPPIKWTLDNWAEFAIGVIAFVLGMYLWQFANRAYRNAFINRIRADYPNVSSDSF